MDIAKYSKSFSVASTKEFKGHKGKVHCVAWSSDGRKIASSSIDQTARVFTVDKNHSSGTSTKASIELKGHQGDVDQLCWDPTNSDKLATVSVDKTIKLWDIRTPKNAVHTIDTMGENINITWSPDGNHIAVGNRDDEIIFIDVRASAGSPESKSTILNSLKCELEVNEISWDKSGKYFFLTTGAGSIRVFEYTSLGMIEEVLGHTANCYCIDMDPRGRYFAVGSADALVSLWDIQDLSCIRTFSALDWPVRSVSFSYDGEFIAAGSEDSFIDISHVETEEQVYKISTTAATNSIAWHPSKHWLAYAGDCTDRHGRDEGNLFVFGFST